MRAPLFSALSLALLISTALPLKMQGQWTNLGDVAFSIAHSTTLYGEELAFDTYVMVTKVNEIAAIMLAMSIDGQQVAYGDNLNVMFSVDDRKFGPFVCIEQDDAGTVIVDHDLVFAMMAGQEMTINTGDFVIRTYLRNSSRAINNIW